MANQKAGNYARAFNAAAAIVAAQDTGDAELKVIVGAVGELAEALFKQQNKFIKKNDLTEELSGSSSKRSGGSSRRGSGSSGLSENQERAVKKAIASLESDGEESPYTIKELEKLDPSGGKNSERSEAIGEIFELAYGKN